MTLFSAVKTDWIEVRGTIYSFNVKYVYLKNNRGIKTMVPRKYIPKDLIKSKKEIRVHVKKADYIAMSEEVERQKSQS